MYTVRMFVPRRLGACVLTLSNPDITEASVVHVSVCRCISFIGPFARDLIADISIFDPPTGEFVIGT